MLKPVAAGLMCLVFVTLGVAISRGQDEEGFRKSEEIDLIVVDGKVGAKEVTDEEAKRLPPPGVTFTAGPQTDIYGPAPSGEAGFSANGQRIRVVQNDKGGVTVYGEDEKIIERHDAGATPARALARFTRLAQAQQVVDPQTRESLEKMAGGLKEQIQKLQSEGKQDEAQQKARSLGAIQALLHGNPQVRYLQAGASLQNMEEIKKLHDRMRALVEESSKLPEGAAAERDKIKQEIAKIQKEIAEKHPNVFAAQPSFGSGQPFVAGMAPQGFGMQPPGTQQFHGGGFGIMVGSPFGFGSSAGTALLRKSEALSQAATQLKTNGLDEQAQPLLAKAEQLKAEAQKVMQEEAEKRRAEGAGQGGGGGGFGSGGIAVFGGAPPMELQRSIRELQEQIQQLRKEVGELRELLQRKP